jgi:hypothetical protein
LGAFWAQVDGAYDVADLLLGLPEALIQQSGIDLEFWRSEAASAANALLTGDPGDVGGGSSKSSSADGSSSNGSSIRNTSGSHDSDEGRSGRVEGGSGLIDGSSDSSEGSSSGSSGSGGSGSGGSGGGDGSGGGGVGGSGGSSNGGSGSHGSGSSSGSGGSGDGGGAAHAAAQSGADVGTAGPSPMERAVRRLIGALVEADPLGNSGSLSASAGETGRRRRRRRRLRQSASRAQGSQALSPAAQELVEMVEASIRDISELSAATGATGAARDTRDCPKTLIGGAEVPAQKQGRRRLQQQLQPPGQYFVSGQAGPHAFNLIFSNLFDFALQRGGARGCTPWLRCVENAQESSTSQENSQNLRHTAFNMFTVHSG